MTREALVGNRGDQALGANGWRLIVVKVQPQFEWEFLFDADVQGRFARGNTRLELSVKPLDARIFEQELKPLLQRVDVKRRTGGQRQPVLIVARAQPPVAFDIDVLQRALDDLKRDDAV